MGLEGSSSTSSAASDPDINSAIYNDAIIEESRAVHEFDRSEFPVGAFQGVFGQKSFTSENAFVLHIGSTVVCKIIKQARKMLFLDHMMFF